MSGPKTVTNIHLPKSFWDILNNIQPIADRDHLRI